MATTYRVWGMHCGACESRVADAVRALPGVTRASADAGAGTLTVDADREIARDALSRAVSAAGQYALMDADAIADQPARQPGDVTLPIAHTTTHTATHTATHAATQTPAQDQSPNQGQDRDQSRDQVAPPPTPPASTAASGYRALAILIAYLTGASVLGALPTLALDAIMANFMGGFFLAFSFFKFLDLKGFAASYARYDIIARKWVPWRTIYPFVELVLGLLYLSLPHGGWLMIVVNAITLILMLAGTVGVVRSMIRRDKVRCACLGAVINLPVGMVTLIEDLGMAAMAAAMLYLHFAPDAPTPTP